MHARVTHGPSYAAQPGVKCRLSCTPVDRQRRALRVLGKLSCAYEKRPWLYEGISNPGAPNATACARTETLGRSPEERAREILGAELQ